MSSRNVKILAAIVLLLFGVLFALNSTDRSDSQTGAQMLFPEIKSRLNDLNLVTITDADGTITLQREAEDQIRERIKPQISIAEPGGDAPAGE